MREKLETGKGEVPLWALLHPQYLRLEMLTINKAFHHSTPHQGFRKHSI